MTLYRICSNVFDYIITHVSLTKEPKYLNTGVLNIIISKSIITSTFRIFTDYPIYNNSEKIHSQSNCNIVENILNNTQVMFESLMNPEFIEILNINETQDAIIYSLNIVNSVGFKVFYYFDGNLNCTNPDGCAYFVSLPNIFVSRENKYLNLENIIMQTVISKLLGPLDTWLSRIKVSHSSRYNCIHFTPIQHISNSAYAIIDHTMLNKTFNFEPNRPCTFNDVKNVIEIIDVEMGMLCISDIVLNHMVFDGPFLTSNPNCAYNLKNCPHLIPAYMLDQAVQLFSREIEKGNWESHGINKCINKDNELLPLRTVLEQKLNELNLEDFFMVSISDQLINLIIEEIECLKIEFTNNEDVYLNLKQINSSFVTSTIMLIDNFESRKVTTVDVKSTAYFLLKIHASSIINRDIVYKFLTDLNKSIQQELRQNLDVAMGNIIDGVRYRFIDPKGLCLGNVSLQNPLVERYFHTSNQIFESIEVAEEFIKLNGDKCMLHNGWIMQNNNPLIDPAGRFSQAYFRREINPWTDTIKLFYGSSPQDNLLLWNYMAEYCKQTVSIFKGVRIDNCHNTPLHVLKYFVAIMREVRKDLLLVAELFTCDKKFDDIFISELGIHFLLTDVSTPSHSHHLAEAINKYLTPPGFTNIIPRIHQSYIKSHLSIQNLINLGGDDQVEDDQILANNEVSCVATNEDNNGVMKMNEVCIDFNNEAMPFMNDVTNDVLNINDVTSDVLKTNDVTNDVVMMNDNQSSDKATIDSNYDCNQLINNERFKEIRNLPQTSSNINLVCNKIFFYLNKTQQIPFNKLEEIRFSINKNLENSIYTNKTKEKHINNNLMNKATENCIFLYKKRIESISLNNRHCRYLIFDQNHDNRSIVEERGCGWMLGIACLTCLLVGPIGSVRGCDELVPHRICVVDETRLYKINGAENWKGNANASEKDEAKPDQFKSGSFESDSGCDDKWKNNCGDNLLSIDNGVLNELEYLKETSSCVENQTKLNDEYVDMDTGIFKIRNILNIIHICLNNHAFAECRIAPYENILSIERWQIQEYNLFDKLNCAELIKRTDANLITGIKDQLHFVAEKVDLAENPNKRDVTFNRNNINNNKANYFVLAVTLSDHNASFEIRHASIVEILFKFEVEDSKYVNGKFVYDSAYINGLDDIATNLERVYDVDKEFTIIDNGSWCKIEILNPKIGTGYFMRCKLNFETITLLEEVENFFHEFDFKDENDEFSRNLISLPQDDTNYILYGDDNYGFYHVPNFGNLKYCGFAGVYLAYIDMVQSNNVSNHPLYINMLEGDWLMDYCCNRLEPCESLVYISNLTTKMCNQFKGLPKSFSIQYFCAYVDAIYSTCFQNDMMN